MISVLLYRTVSKITVILIFCSAFNVLCWPCPRVENSKERLPKETSKANLDADMTLKFLYTYKIFWRNELLSCLYLTEFIKMINVFLKLRAAVCYLNVCSYVHVF